MKGALARQLALLAAASAGGAALALLGVPAGALSGAMIGTTILAGFGGGAPLHPVLRAAAMLFSGVGIGTAVTPTMLAGIARYPASIALMTLAVLAMTAVATWWLERGMAFTRPTALFSAVPGAMTYVLTVAPTLGADMQKVAVVQLLRNFTLIALLPLVIAETPIAAAVRPSVAAHGPSALAIIAAGAIACGILLERARVAAGMLFGAIVFSGLLHGTGLLVGTLSPLAQGIGQVLIGAWTGSRFVGFDWRLLGRSSLAACGTLVIAGLIAAGGAGLATAALHVPFGVALLAFAPGGLEAMTVLAYALGLDPLYVGAHHLARFGLISLALPFVVRAWLGRPVTAPPVR